MKKTQHNKIYNLFEDGQWHCQVDHWNLFIRSPHKRREEIEEQGKVHFHWKPCQHGYQNVRDYFLLETPKNECLELRSHISSTKTAIKLKNSTEFGEIRPYPPVYKPEALFHLTPNYHKD